jgi:hypothetical protein
VPSPAGGGVGGVQDGDIFRIDPDGLGAVPPVVFEFDSNPQHLGVIVGTAPLMMLHAYMPARKVVEHRLDEQWMKRAKAFFRIRGIQ